MKAKSRMLTIVLISAIAIAVNAQEREISGFQNPESVIAYKNRLYVTNLGSALDPTAKDGDGYISMLRRKDGKVLEERFITGLNSPKGMFVKHGKLCIADVDRVMAYDLKKRKVVWQASLAPEGVTYANDITNIAGGVLVSSTDNNALYKVCKSGHVEQMKVKGNLYGANGMVRGARKVYVANYGHGDEPVGGFGKVKLTSKKYKEFRHGGIYDGIVRIPGRLVLTDWGSTHTGQGCLVSYRPAVKKFQDVNTDRTFNGPADLYTDKKTKTVWVPVMNENKLVAFSFADIRKK